MAAKTRTKRKRPITPEDLLRFRLPSQPRIAPDGGHIVFVEKTTGEKNDYRTNLWVVSTSGTKARRFTHGDKDSSPAWSPDGKTISFVSKREKHAPQLALIPFEGGEARTLTSFPEGSIGGYRWSPDGTKIAVSFREQHADWTEAAKSEREEHGLSEPPKVVEDYWYRLDGDGYFLDQRFHITIVDVASGEHRRLYARDRLGGASFDFSPSSRELVVSTNRHRKAMLQPWRDELVRVDVATGKVTPIPNLPEGPKSNVRWSPDGKHIAYVGRDGGTDGLYSVENLDLFVCDPKRGGAKNLTKNTDHCLLAVAVADSTEAVFAPCIEFAPNSARVFYRLGWHGAMQIASASVRGGSVTVHTGGNIDRDMGNISANGRMALLEGNATQLARVSVGDCRGKKMTTRSLGDRNRELLGELDLARPKGHWVRADDGHRVHVWVMKPPKLGARRKAPAVLEIHGGPHAQYGWGFFHEFQVLAAQGYTVFYSNPRGSKGYGRDHCAAIRGSWGGADWLDVQAVTEFMKQQSFVDSRRMGVMGGSYGGYMTNWTIGHTHDFAGAITDRCVSNLISMSGNSDHMSLPDTYFPGNSWDDVEARWELSPLKYFGNVKTPTLIIHSEGDLRCNIEQSEQIYTVLKVRGIPTRFVRYPRSTSHGMSRMGPPDLRLHRLGEIVAWWKKVLA